MGEAMDSWLKNILEESSAQWKYWEQLYQQREEKSFAWNGYFKAYLGQTTKPNGRGLLLTGPDGCGKHTAARSMMRQLKEKKFQRVFLSGLWLDAACPEEALKKISSILETLYSKEKDLCLLVEELEQYPYRREVLNYLGRMLRDYGLKESTALFLILIDREEKTIPSGLRDQLQLCRMGLPDLNQRLELIQQYNDEINHRLSLEHFARITEGLSYAQLKDLVVAVCWMMDSRKIATYLTNEDLEEFCRRQAPLPAPEDAMPSIARSVRELVETLPTLLEKLPANVVPLPNPNPNPPNPNPNPINEKTEVDRIKKLAPKGLASELFGTDFLEEIEAIEPLS